MHMWSKHINILSFFKFSEATMLVFSLPEWCQSIFDPKRICKAKKSYKKHITPE